MSLTRAIPVVVADASAVVETIGGEPVWEERVRRWRSEGVMILAPVNLRTEVANALLLGVGLDASDVIGRMRHVFEAGLDVADRGLVGVFDAIELAARHGLTVYDAAYLALALEVDGELATTDRALAAAALAEGVSVLS